MNFETVSENSTMKPTLWKIGISWILRICSFFFTALLVRELRQSVRNRVINFGLLIYLTIMVVISLYFLLDYSVNPARSTDLGEQMSKILIMVVLHCSLIAIVLHTVGRLILERIHQDLMYYSTMKPSEFVMGKWMGGLIISLVFYSATLPFLCIAYLFRGIDITTLVADLSYTFAMVQLLHLCAITLFAGTHSIATAVFRGAGLLAIGAGIYYILLDIFLGEFHRFGFSTTLFFTGIFYVLLPGVLFFVAKGQFAPPESNRIWGFRVFSTVVLLLSFSILFILDFMPRFDGILSIWYFFLPYPLCCFFFISICERSEYGLRLRQSIPAKNPARLFAFPFYSGDCNGLVWSAFWILLSVPIWFMMPSHSYGDEEMLSISSMVLLFFFYAVLSLVLWKAIFYRWVKKEWIGLITIGLIFLGLFVSVVLKNADLVPSDYYGTVFDDLIFFPDFFWWIYWDSSELKHIKFHISIVFFLAAAAMLFLIWKDRFRKFVRFVPNPYGFAGVVQSNTAEWIGESEGEIPPHFFPGLREIRDAREKKQIAPFFENMEMSLLKTYLQGYGGRGWCEDREEPRIAVVEYRDLLFFGGNPELLEKEQRRKICSFLPRGDQETYVFCDDPRWIAGIEEAHREKARKYTRFSMSWNPESVDREKLRAFTRSLSPEFRLEKMEQSHYEQAMQREWSRDFCSFFISSQDFCENGLGFCVLHEERLIAGASSYAIYEGGLEVQVQTETGFQHRGLATACSAALLLECMDRNLVPNWDAIGPPSRDLALKLGYTLSREYDAIVVYEKAISEPEA